MRQLNLNGFKVKIRAYLKAIFQLKVLATCVFISSMSGQAYADKVLQTEKKLLTGLHSVQNLNLDQALHTFSELGDNHPKYKLAQLLKADLLAAKAGQVALIQKVHSQNAQSVDTLLAEAEVRWQFSKDSMNGVTEFDDFVLKSAQQKHIILISLEESRLYLFERNSKGQMVRVTDYYVTMGRKGSGKQKEGDLRTPIGVYHMVDLLPGSTLPDLYGVGALPLNYPNLWDKEQGKTGSGIWLHGVPSNTYIRPPKASRGCVVLNNTAMSHLLAEYQLPFSTPVVIVDQPLPSVQLAQSKRQLLSEIKAWLQDNNHKVRWEDVSVYRYPNETNLYYITFPGQAKENLIEQFWQRKADGHWQVVVQTPEQTQVASK